MTSVATVHAHGDPESLGVEVVGYVDEVKRSVARGETLNISIYDPQNDKSSFVHTQQTRRSYGGELLGSDLQHRISFAVGMPPSLLLEVHMAATNI